MPAVSTNDEHKPYSSPTLWNPNYGLTEKKSHSFLSLTPITTGDRPVSSSLSYICVTPKSLSVEPKPKPAFLPVIKLKTESEPEKEKHKTNTSNGNKTLNRSIINFQSPNSIETIVNRKKNFRNFRYNGKLKQKHTEPLTEPKSELNPFIPKPTQNRRTFSVDGLRLSKHEQVNSEQIFHASKKSQLNRYCKIPDLKRKDFYLDNINDNFQDDKNSLNTRQNEMAYVDMSWDKSILSHSNSQPDTTSWLEDRYLNSEKYWRDSSIIECEETKKMKTLAKTQCTETYFNEKKDGDEIIQMPCSMCKRHLTSEDFLAKTNEKECFLHEQAPFHKLNNLLANQKERPYNPKRQAYSKKHGKQFVKRTKPQTLNMKNLKINRAGKKTKHVLQENGYVSRNISELSKQFYDVLSSHTCTDCRQEYMEEFKERMIETLQKVDRLEPRTPPCSIVDTNTPTQEPDVIEEWQVTQRCLSTTPDPENQGLQKVVIRVKDQAGLMSVANVAINKQ